MTRLLSATVAILAVAALPAWAQTGTTKHPSEVTTPSGQNSGAGIAGKPGSKAGRTVRPPTSGTSSAGSGTSEPQSPATRHEDTAGIKGKPGNKSGPTQQPPSNGTSK